MKDKIYNYIVQYGPIITTQISKYFKLDTMYAGAYLSELVSNKKIKYTNKKIGGSPLYYVDDQKDKLEEKLDAQLSKREKEIISILKNKKVVKEDSLDPVQRVVIKDLKDFAVQVVVNFKDKKEIFWKWYLISKEDTESLIKDIFNPKPDKEQESAKDKSKIIEKPAVEEVKEEPKPPQPDFTEYIEMINKLVSENHSMKDLVDKLKQDIELLKTTFKSSIDELKTNIAEIPKTIKVEEKKTEIVKSKEPEEIKAPKLQLSITGFIKYNDSIKDDFLDVLKDYFKKDDVKIDKVKIVKSSSLIECIVKIPTPLGDMTYFCDARNKKRINDGDLSTAFLNGQLNNLPVLFVTPGSLTKKAESMLQNFKNMIVKQNIK